MTRENRDEDAAFSKVVDHLAESHPDTPRDHIEAAVDEARAHYDDAAVRDFVPILAEREARSAIEHPEEERPAPR